MARQAKDTHERVYRQYLEILKQRQGLIDREPETDFRTALLSRRFDQFNVGFKRENIRTAFSANLPSLFPDLVALNDPQFGKSRNFLAYGSIVEDPELSHDSAMKLLPHVGLQDSIHFFEMGFLASCNSWSEAISNRSPKMACLGYVYDDMAQYYMTDYPNRLTQKLNSDANIPDQEKRRVTGLIDRITRQRISKYNSQPIYWPAMTPGYRKRVLVVDQNFSDASNLYGRATPETFARMLECAIAENPDAEILVKTHPDLNWVTNGRRTGYFNHMQSSGRVRIIRDAVNPFCLFDLVDKVYVGTSGMGLEALLAGKQVVCFGAPFYAGWGFTDDRQPIPHRQRPRRIEEVFYFFYLWYTIYHVPGCKAPSRIEDALDYIEANRPVRLPATAQERPKISIVIPVHGVERYIAECLRSIQLQTFQDYEIITVNDVSPDRSQDIIDGIAKHDRRLRPVILTENIGPGFARNRGIEEARGDYIVFIDPDDYMPDPGHLERLVLDADTDRADMVRYRKAFEQVEDEAGRIVEQRPDKSEAAFGEDFHAQRFTDRPVIAHSRHFWNWMYRRSFLNANNVRFLTTYREERAFLVQAYLADPVISSIDSDGVVYRIRRDSAVRRQQTDSDVRDQLSNFEQVIDLLEKAGATDPGNPLHWYMRFQVSQFLHYLFFGFAYKTAANSADPAFLRGFCDRLGAVLRRTGLSAKDLLPDPVELYEDHLDAGAYGLIHEALRSGKYEFIPVARNMDPISFETLHQELSDCRHDGFRSALNRYARNERVLPAQSSVPSPFPKPRIVIHIGATKTGSTSIQHLMEENRPTLLKNGVWYPEVGLFWQKNRAHKQAGHARFIDAAIAGETSLRDYIEHGLATMNGSIHTIVLSSEAFFLHPRAHEIARYFDGYDIEMIVYLRRQDEWANAQYAEFVAGGAVSRVSVPFREWMADPLTQRRLDYRKPITSWAEIVGRRNVHVRVFEKSQLTGGDLIADFAATAKLPVLSMLPSVSPEKQNTARLSTAHVEVLRLYNTRKFLNREAYFRFIEESTLALNEWRRTQGFPMPKPWLLENGQAEKIMADAETSNREIATRYLDREDRQLFDDPVVVPETTPLYPQELAILSACFDRHKSVKSEQEQAKIVNYGLFGWRLWLLSPLVRRRLLSRGSQDHIDQFDSDPATFLHNMGLERQRRMAQYLYPKGNIYGPFSILKIWIPPISWILKKKKYDRLSRQFQESPVAYFRRHPRWSIRILGRILFPFGEMQRSGNSA